jgi:ribosomal protein S27AE
MSTHRACPHCGDDSSLWSDELASIMYDVLIRADGTVVYRGTGYDVMDEGTTCRDHLYCRACGAGPMAIDELMAGELA